MLCHGEKQSVNRAFGKAGTLREFTKHQRTPGIEQDLDEFHGFVDGENDFIFHRFFNGDGLL